MRLRIGILAVILFGVLCIGLFLAQRSKQQPPQNQAISVTDTSTHPVQAISTQQFLPKKMPSTVRVAAIQCASRMGKVVQNRKMISDLVTQAAVQGAKIVVLPECALQGYMDPAMNKVWVKESGESDDENELNVRVAAENVPGSSTRHFSELSKSLKIYLALPLIEADGEAYYNSLVLLGPDGEIAAKHRKHALWPPGDASWASEGKGPAATADTPYGRLGLMVCYDVHEMPKKLKDAGAEIVLYAVGWYGPAEIFFRELFPRRHVIPNGFSVVAANWSGVEKQQEWDGQGYSCVIDKRGVVMAMAKTTTGSEIVITELPVGKLSAAHNATEE